MQKPDHLYPIDLPLSRGEITLLSQALNEILNGPEAIEEREFGTRIGATRVEAEDLQSRLLAALRQPQG